MADKMYSFQGLSFSDQYCKQKLQDVLLLYTNLIGINVIIIIWNESLVQCRSN